MMRSSAAVALLFAGFVWVTPPLLAAQVDEPATGFALWARVSGRSSVQDLASSAVGAPQFAIGSRGGRFTIGLGLGLSVIRVTDKDTSSGQTLEDKVTATAFQLGPTAMLDVWQSADARVRGQLVAGVGVGRVSITETNQFVDIGGVSTTETKTTGTMLGLHLALGGEYFLHQHFALGVEGGFQGTFALGVEEEGSARRQAVGASGAYGALRAMVVF